MSVSGGPDIVENGLVLYLDAANPRSYVSGSLVWNDVSTNGNSGSITNPIRYDTSSAPAINFATSIDDITGAGGRVACGHRIKDAENITISVWVKPNTLVSTQHIWWEGESGDGFGSQQEIHLTTKMPTPSIFTDYTIGVWGFGGLNISAPLSSSGTYSNVTVTLGNMSGSNTGVTGSLYINGQLQASSMTFISRSLYTNEFRLGRPASDIRYFAGAVGTLVMYNKVLTENEIFQNFNALRSRFGV